MKNLESNIPPVLWISGPPGCPKDQLAEKLENEISNRKTQSLLKKTIANYFSQLAELEEKKMLNQVKSLTLTAKLIQQNNIIPIFSCWLTFESQLEFLKGEIKNLYFLTIEPPLKNCLDNTNNDRERKLLNSAIETDISIPDPTEFGQGVTLQNSPVRELLDTTLEYLNEENIITDSSDPDSEEVVDRLKNIGYI